MSIRVTNDLAKRAQTGCEHAAALGLVEVFRQCDAANLGHQRRGVGRFSGLGEPGAHEPAGQRPFEKIAFALHQFAPYVSAA
jgi:hypothetical protein